MADVTFFFISLTVIFLVVFSVSDCVIKQANKFQSFKCQGDLPAAGG